MASQSLATSATTLIETYGNTAKNVVRAYRVGNARAAHYLDQTLSAVVNKAGRRLSAPSRLRALAAQKKLSNAYVHAIALSADTAEVAINKALDFSGKTIAQLAANSDRFEAATGVTSLASLAQYARPAAQAAHKLASTLETQSERLLHTVGGAAKPAHRKASAKRATTRKSTAAKKATPRSARRAK